MVLATTIIMETAAVNRSDSPVQFDFQPAQP
jgi:hypothetical protein